LYRILAELAGEVILTLGTKKSETPGMYGPAKISLSIAKYFKFGT